MSELKLNDAVFPFKCKHPKCDKVYDIGQFKDVALLWGFIYLTCGEFNLIGLTCPHCHFTTVNKYKFFTPDFSLKLLEEHNAPRDSQGNIFSSDFRFFIPFSPLILVESNLLSASVLEQENNKEVNYYIPDFAQTKVGYSQKIKSEFPYSIAEEVMQNLCMLEYKEKVKAIPRIVSSSSIYQYTDSWLSSSLVDQIPFNNRQWISDQFDMAFNFSNSGTFASLIKTTITSEEWRDIDFEDETLAWEREESAIHWEDFFREYKRVRNTIDFEVTYKSNFLDKYIRLLFWERGQGERFTSDIEDNPIQPAEPSDDYLFLEDMTPAQLKAARQSKNEPAIHVTEPRPEFAVKSTQGETKLEPVDYYSPINSSKRSDSNITEHDNVFYRHGLGVWVVKFKGEETTIPDNKRVLYLALLLKQPGIPYSNESLFGDVGTIFSKKEIAINSMGQQPDNIRKEKLAKQSGLSKYSSASLDKVETNISPEDKEDWERYIQIQLQKLSEVEDADKRIEYERIFDELEKISISIRKVHKGTFKYGKDQKFGNKMAGSYYYTFYISRKKSTDESEKHRKAVAANIKAVINDIANTDRLPNLVEHLQICTAVKQFNAIYDPNKHTTEKSTRWYVSESA